MNTRTIENRLGLLEQKLQPRKNRAPVCFLRDGMTIEEFRKIHNLSKGDRVHVVRFISGKNEH